MAKFALQPGERVLYRERVAVSREESRGGELILTNRRIVLLAGGKMSRLDLFGIFIIDGARPTAISHQIAREQLAVAESNSRLLRVESDGEGYGKTWFEVETKTAADWAARLKLWASSGDVA